LRRPINSVRISALVLSLVATFPLAAKHPPEKPLDLNSATAEQLEQLPGIGPKLAAEIVEFREKSWPFRRVEDLLAIRGISKRKLDAIRPYVIVIPPTNSSSRFVCGSKEMPG